MELAILKQYYKEVVETQEKIKQATSRLEGIYTKMFEHEKPEVHTIEELKQKIMLEIKTQLFQKFEVEL
ncbi:MAG: hypothetical protein COY53_07280 [Elusimicrobia bacterium CG_4_10_14_0_8_um_filter_37_32]|nr:MAG: hypothetical protein COY53_07280 [Elusimicrobia bacterium CG_4_10_14_0_8_um_filter_37_32]